MTLRIESQEADALARALIELTGESLTEAVTTALRERLERERRGRLAGEEFVARVVALADRLRPAYDTRPVSPDDWHRASGELPGLPKPCAK
jgi:antitoxin VapB